MPTSNWKSAIRGAKLNLAASLRRLNSDLVSVSVAGQLTVPFSSPFDVGDGFGNAASPANIAMTFPPRLKRLVGFTGMDGSSPRGGLIADAAGNLFGTTAYGGSNDYGTVFEVAKTPGGYASAPTTLVSFTDTNGAFPTGNLIADAVGNLFGTTEAGGANGDGTVFEIAKTEGGYASTPTALVSFAGANGLRPDGSLIADAAGDLFGTTAGGGAYSDGTVFEIAKTQTGYAGAPTTLVSFTGPDGLNPVASLIADAAGDLFGTTQYGGAHDEGTVFEITKTADGYVSTPTTLVSFMGTNGAYPYGSLIADAAGDLFGTTNAGNPGGSVGWGTVFEIAKIPGGYASAPTTVVSFTRGYGANPTGGLMADATGNLFGTTNGGPNYKEGSVFEIFHSGFVVPPPPPAAFAQAMASHGAGGFGAAGPALLASRNEPPTLLSLPRAA